MCVFHLLNLFTNLETQTPSSGVMTLHQNTFVLFNERIIKCKVRWYEISLVDFINISFTYTFSSQMPRNPRIKNPSVPQAPWLCVWNSSTLSCREEKYLCCGTFERVGIFHWFDQFYKWLSHISKYGFPVTSCCLWSITEVVAFFAKLAVTVEFLLGIK